MSDQFDPDRFPKPNDDFGTNNPYVSPIAEEVASEGYVTRTGESLNPWFSVWTKPRATIRQIVETDPTYLVLVLAVLGGIASAFDPERAAKVGQEVVQRLGFVGGMIFGGAVGGLIGLYLFGWLVGITGRWLGGRASSERVRAALAWANVPSIWILPLTMALVTAWVMVGNDFLDVDATPQYAAIWLVYYLLFLVVAIWQVVVACHMVGEVHEFSSWRGLGSLLLAGLVVFLVVVLPLVAVMLAIDVA